MIGLLVWAIGDLKIGNGAEHMEKRDWWGLNVIISTSSMLHLSSFWRCRTDNSRLSLFYHGPACGGIMDELVLASWLGSNHFCSTRRMHVKVGILGDYFI